MVVNRFLHHFHFSKLYFTMKKLLFLFCSITFLFSSCDDQLDIQPQQAISTEVALSSEQGVRTALVGTYGLWTASPNSSGNILMNSEMLIDVDNLFWTNFVTDLNQLLDKRMNADNSAAESFWINSYNVINQTNSILAALEVVNESDQVAIAGEARFLRGQSYFDLVNQYAKPWTAGSPSNNLGVPIVTTPSIQNLSDPIIPRNTVAEVYQLILEDLEFAKANLPTQNGIFANSLAASALLSRVYLMQENFELAAAEAERVIASGVYHLVPDLANVFNASDNTSEDIFALQITPMDFGHSLNFFYSGELEGGGGFIGITEAHLEKYEADDLRKELFYLDEQSSTRRTSKWQPNPFNDGNLTLIRLAEMYLTRAESRFRTGDILGATQDLNIIRKRAGLHELSSTDLSLEVILKERFLELIFEGHQFRDAKRNRKWVRDLPFNDARLIYPIPLRELEVNRALVQNEGY